MQRPATGGGPNLDARRCHLNAGAGYCLRNAYGCRYCDPFLEATDVPTAERDGDTLDAVPADAHAAADERGPIGD